MERLTNNALPMWGYMDNGNELRDYLDRLAAYEDTGLEPEEVCGLCEMDSRARMADLLRLEEYQALGPVHHLRELAQAEQEGRLVVLQCAVGDIVYALWSVPTADKYIIYCAEAKEIRISNGACRVATTYLLEPIEFRGRRMEYRDDNFGKTVFLSRKEAEAALEARKGGGEG